jgi:cell division septation protein DedD
MATDKTFTVAGVSKLNGDYKVRFANDIMRIKNLAKSGHEDIRLADLESAMTKLEAVKAISTMDEFQDAAAQSVIAEYLEENTPKSPKAKVSKPVATKATKTPAVKATAKVTEDEDAPF